MAKQNILLIDDDKETCAFLLEYFSDTRSSLTPAQTKKEADHFLDSSHPDLILINPKIAGPHLRQRLSRIKAPSPLLKILALEGEEIAVEEGIPFDGWLDKPLQLESFQKKLFETISFPEKVKILMVDDEEALCQSIKEFLEFRPRPKFEVDYSLNGLEGFKKLDTFRPDLIILDIKMPVRSGSDLYREIKRKKQELPTIVLTASVSTEELEEMRRYGPPVFVEKGGRESSFPELLNIIRKHIAFS